MMHRSRFISGMATGLVVGAAVAMAVRPNKSSRRAIRRTTGRAMRAVGTIVDNLTS